MIEKMVGLPENVLGFKATGTVKADDYKFVLIPAVEEMLARRGKVRMLYFLGPDFSEFQVAAMWDDTKLGLKHLAGWERVALVTDIEWIRLALKVFGLVIPGKVRVFHNGELSEAKRWISE